MTTAIKTYHRPDGVVGCGFYGEFGGLWQHSISWPDCQATRMRYEDLEDRKIEVKDLKIYDPSVDYAPLNMADGTLCDRDLLNTEVASVEVMPPVAAEPTADWSQPADVKESLDRAAEKIMDSVGMPPVDPPAPEDANPFDTSKSEAENIRAAIALMPGETNKGIIEVLNRYGVNVSSSQVTRERKAIAKAAGTIEETAGE